MKLLAQADAKGGVAKARAYKREMAVGMKQNATLAGKMAAYRCHQFTNVARKKDIATDVRKAYGVIGEEDWQYKAYGMIKEYKGEKKANAWMAGFYGHAKAGDEDAELYSDPVASFQKIRFPKGRRTANEEEYLAYRKANNYKLPGGKDPKRRILGMVTGANRDKLEKKRMDTRGLAKIAWKACFERLNKGRKSNVVSVMGDTEKKFEPEFKKAYAKFGKQELGSAHVKYGKNGFNVKLTNHVRYADAAFLDWGRDKVGPLVIRYMTILFDLRKKNAKKAADAASIRRAERRMAA